MAAGLVTWDRLQGAAHLRVFPDIYVPVGDAPPKLALRSRAAYRLVEGRGVLSGYSAAEILGASCGPEKAPAEVTVPGGGQRAHPGLLVHRDRLARDEVRCVGDIRVTTPMRTAYDLARWHDLVEGVVAVDALARKGEFGPDKLLHLAARYPRARNHRRVADVLVYANRSSGSPMESRLRMLIELAGLPRPVVQHAVQDDPTRTAVWLDLAYPDHMIGIEYEGEVHASTERVLRDVGRYTRLVDKGWRIYRYTKYEIHREQQRILDEVGRALERVR
ncbi:MAG: hypothetical protein J0I49_03455 [Pseudonocardia sp.]|uniref:hypothetical protein n=1 Tax=Pseudonocardia sp. TaxID=60912 RepID=UPI001AD4181C|nr:hypothetical protein [Pseudonocardia sp.]MBN9097156.1 hypothetical protein [Pseudonocardia sp.]